MLRPEHSLALNVQPIEIHRFATMLNADALVDENYFGLGICHWSLNWATVRFESATTRFVGAIAMDQIATGKSVKLYYLTSDYHQKQSVGTAVFGEETDLFTAEAGPRFTLTITPQEASK